MNVAIIGAGLSGLATAWHLLSHPYFSFKVTLFDAIGIGGGASGMAAGLLHPYAGAHAKLNFLGKEALATTLPLLKIAEETLKKPICSSPGLLRVALTKEQKIDYKRCALQHPEEVNWLTSRMCHQLLPLLTPAPGLWVKQGLTVDCPLYLEGLWQACEQKGALFYQRLIAHLKEIEEFDIKIIAVGAGFAQFPEMTWLKLNCVKGQLLEIEWPSWLPPLPFSINSQAYLAKTPLKGCIAGSTFERGFTTQAPEIDSAIKEIMPKIVALIPGLKKAAIINCTAGIRAFASDHLPKIKKLGPHLWAITAMGSKGLLYHSFMAQKLVQEICQETSLDREKQ